MIEKTVICTSLVVLLRDLGCIQFGQFQLTSGQESDIYIDLRLLMSDPVAMRTVARAYGQLLEPLEFDRIAAIPYAGLPIGMAVALETNRPLIYPRARAKEHGTKRTVEGVFVPGETVVVLDDLITTGGSKLTAIRTLETAGLRVRDVVVLLDREQGGGLALLGYQLHSILALSELRGVRC